MISTLLFSKQRRITTTEIKTANKIDWDTQRSDTKETTGKNKDGCQAFTEQDKDNCWEYGRSLR